MRIWIVGASSGIGLQLVKLWLKQGHEVIASSRTSTSNDALLSLQERFSSRLKLLDINVRNTASHEAVVKEAFGALGGLSMWFYNAGAYEPLSVNALSVEKLVLMNEVNYMGAASLLVEVLKHASKDQGFRMVFNASISSYFGLPHGGAYSAPKAALVNLAQSIYPELKQHGIKLQIINHGFVATKLTQKNSFTMPQLMTPLQAAVRIDKALKRTTAFEIRFPKGLVFALALLRVMPSRLALYLTKKVL